MKRAWSLFLVSLLLAGCRLHTLEDGDYVITPTEIIRDDCGLAGMDLLGTATLRTEGNLVYLTLAKPALRLAGTYRFNLEEITMDGSISNFSTSLRGRECLLDNVQFHMDTNTTSTRTFSGQMSISYEARQPDDCVCKFWFQFDASR